MNTQTIAQHAHDTNERHTDIHMYPYKKAHTHTTQRETRDYIISLHNSCLFQKYVNRSPATLYKMYVVRTNNTTITMLN